MSAGYSGTPLVRKLGFRPGWRIGVVDGPDSLPGLLGELPEGAELIAGLGPALDAVWLFAVSRDGLEERLRAEVPGGYAAALDTVGTDEAIDASLALIEDRDRIVSIAAFVA